MQIYDMKVNRMPSPIGILHTEAVFSFKADTGQDYIFRLFDSQVVINPLYEQSVPIAQKHCFRIDFSLLPGKSYWWEIVCGDVKSELAFFETGIIFDAGFITTSKAAVCPKMCKTFSLEKEVIRARLYITGLGLYRASINDKRVGADYLTPGFNDYDAYLRYQTYDVTPLLATENKIEVILGDGWYKGRFGLNGGEKNTFGDQYYLAAKLVVDYFDGEHEVIETDGTWQTGESFVRTSSIYDGELQDMRVNHGAHEFCVPAVVKYQPTPEFCAPVREQMILTPDLIISPKGEQILDFKQNMVGFCRFLCRAAAGTQVVLTHGEVLQQGCFYRDNLRSAKAEFKYISDGEEHIVSPLFTF